MIGKRIEDIYKTLKIKQIEFAKVVGASQSTIAQIIKKENNPNSKWLAAIAKSYPNLNTRWLLTGEGEMWDNEEKSVSKQNEKVNVEALQTKVESLERENQLLREMNELLKSKSN